MGRSVEYVRLTTNLVFEFGAYFDYKTRKSTVQLKGRYDMKRNCLLLTTFVLLSCFSVSNAAETYRLPPDNPNPTERYLFYLHGITVELRGPDSYSKRFKKRYSYTKIVNEFARRGYNVGGFKFEVQQSLLRPAR
jgi:hypothetical protein